MNVNNNIITSGNTDYKNIGFLRKSNSKEGFKTILDGHQYRSKGSTYGNGLTQSNKEQLLGKTKIENLDKEIDGNKSIETSETTVEGFTNDNSDNSYDNNELKEKIINFVEVAIDVLKQDAVETEKKIVVSDKATDKLPEELNVNSGSAEKVVQVQVVQIQELLRSLSAMIQSTYEVSTVSKQENKLNPINLEKLVAIKTLPHETKNILNNNFKQIVDLVKQLKVNKGTEPEILDVVRKLTVQVQEVKGDLNLLKVVNQRPKVESKNTKEINYITDNSKLKEKIINFVEVAVDVLKQDAVETEKKIVVSDKATDKLPEELNVNSGSAEKVAQVQVVQIQELLQSLSSMIQSTYEVSKVSKQENELNPINLEKLVGIETLPPETKNILNINLKQIVDLVKQLKGNKGTEPEILDVLRKLTVQVQEVKGDLNLLKRVNQRPELESKITKNLSNTADNSKLKQKIIEFVDAAVDALKQNTVETEKRIVVSGKATDKPSEELEVNSASAEKMTQVQVGQIQELLKSLSAVIQSTYEKPITPNQGNELYPINLEKLVGVSTLPPKTKDILNNNLKEIVDLVKQLKGNKGTEPEILDVVRKLTVQVQEVKGDLNLLKRVNQRPELESKITKELGNTTDNSKLKQKIINFVEVAVDALKQNAVEPEKEFVVSDKATDKPSEELNLNSGSIEKVTQVQVGQIQELLKSLSAVIQSTYEKPITPNQGNELNPINLEKLVGIEILQPKTKGILKNNLSEIVDLVKQLKVNKGTEPEILDVVRKLMVQVQEVKGDLNLLKRVNQRAELESNTTKELSNTADNSKLKQKIINFVEVAVDVLKQDAVDPEKEFVVSDKATDKPSEELNLNSGSIEKVTQVQVGQIQELLKSLSAVIQSTYEKPVTPNQGNELNPINLENLVGVEKLSPETKSILKNNLKEIIVSIENLTRNNQAQPQILDVIQKLTTQVKVVKGDLNLLRTLSFESVNVKSEEKSFNDNKQMQISPKIVKTISEISRISQMQSSNDSRQANKFSGNRSFEEKFLSNLLSDNKDENKISKVVNFMNQFETVKTTESPKIEIPNNLVINKNNFEVDVIKNIKFMEINSIKDLTVKMNPKDLGEITIKLTMESGIMKASISAQNKETFNLLNQNIQDISDRLKNMDIKIQSLDINIYEDSTFFGKGSSSRNSNGDHSNKKATNMGLDDEDTQITNNYVVEENKVNKFV
ncbi:MAG: flagellar hook-length control protein FliK [Clostridium sp.]|uniref:flagellar hook-length control protein FliK n=1 Tax=Clostridium sp. TaxID=1506 RepID=UPI003D6CE66E